MVEADDGHGFSGPRRAATWFSRWLKNEEDRAAESPAPIASEEGYGHKSGQVATKAETVYSLNQKRFAEVRRGGATVGRCVRLLDSDGHSTAAGAAIRQRCRGALPGLVPSEPGIQIRRCSMFRTAREARRGVLAHGAGKSAALQTRLAGRAGGAFRRLRGLGRRAVSRDSDSDWPRYFGDFERNDGAAHRKTACRLRPR